MKRMIDTTSGSTLEIDTPVEFNKDVHANTITSSFNLDTSMTLDNSDVSFTDILINSIKEKDGLVEIHLRASITASATITIFKVGSIPQTLAPLHGHTSVSATISSSPTNVGLPCGSYLSTEGNVSCNILSGSIPQGATRFFELCLLYFI